MVVKVLIAIQFFDTVISSPYCSVKNNLVFIMQLHALVEKSFILKNTVGLSILPPLQRVCAGISTLWVATVGCHYE